MNPLTIDRKVSMLHEARHAARRLAKLIVLAPLFTLAACAIEPGYGYGYGNGYGYDGGGPDVGIGIDYYGGIGYDYGGWGGNYRVGPPRGGRRGGDRGVHAYRPAPASHGMPSLPSGGRGGGGRGGHGGGGGHR